MASRFHSLDTNSFSLRNLMMQIWINLGNTCYYAQFESDFRLRFRKNLWQVFVEMICVCVSHSRKFSPTHAMYLLFSCLLHQMQQPISKFRNHWFSRFFLTNQIVFWQKKNTASNVKIQFLWEGHKDLRQPSSRFWRMTYVKTFRKIAPIFCGPLRKAELYKTDFYQAHFKHPDFIWMLIFFEKVEYIKALWNSKAYKSTSLHIFCFEWFLTNLTSHGNNW